ncbi:MAG: glycosyltransferase [Eubacterium sp.]|nr:glycosyltransferase [Eubacterium sp.]
MEGRAERGFPTNIIAKGKINDLAELTRYYNMADIFANLTRYDNYPTVNLEAISCGTPVVIYDTGGFDESTENMERLYHKGI